MSNPTRKIPAKTDLKGKSIAEVQAAIRGLMILAKKATFNVHSAYALSINCGMCIVDFAEDELDFSPDGYDERDPDDDFVDSDPWRGGPEGDMFG